MASGTEILIDYGPEFDVSLPFHDDPHENKKFSGPLDMLWQSPEKKQRVDGGALVEVSDGTMIEDGNIGAGPGKDDPPKTDGGPVQVWAALTYKGASVERLCAGCGRELWLINDGESHLILYRAEPPHAEAAKTIIFQWQGGAVCSDSKIKEGDITIPLKITAQTNIVYNNKVLAFEEAWEEVRADPDVAVYSMLQVSAAGEKKITVQMLAQLFYKPTGELLHLCDKHPVVVISRVPTDND